MAGTPKRAPEGYLTMAEARARLGVSKMTMAKIVRAADAEVYQDPRDARIKLLRAEDVERMAQPIPAGKAAA
jgi:hypothetical protein